MAAPGKHRQSPKASTSPARPAGRPMVIVTETLAERPAKWIAERVELVWCSHKETKDLDALLPTAEGLIVRTYTQVNDALLDQAPKLKVVGRAGVGLDNIDIRACQRRGVQVVSVPDANTQAVVEYVFGLMLDTLRPRTDLPPNVTDEKFHELRKTEVGKQLDQLSIGIVGFGRIGKRLGCVVNAIGMRLLACDVLSEVQLRKAVDFPFEYVSHEQLYRQSHVVSVHVDGRAENRGMFNAQVFAQLRPDCLFINAARGMLIDNDALAEHLQAHPDFRAILDVHEPEPPGPDYPLWNLPNARMLPHLASRTDQAMENMSWVVRDVWAVLDRRTPNFPAWT